MTGSRDIEIKVDVTAPTPRPSPSPLKRLPRYGQIYYICFEALSLPIVIKPTDFTGGGQAGGPGGSKSSEVRNGMKEEQGRIHGNPVADGWAGAVMRKPLGIQKCDLPTDTARCRVACPRLKRKLSDLIFLFN